MPIPLDTLKTDPELSHTQAVRMDMRLTLDALTKTQTRRLLSLIAEKNPVLSRAIGALLDDLEPTTTARTVTFHPSYAYEEFVEGIRPVLTDASAGGPQFTLRDGIFKEVCLTAHRRPDLDFYLVVDEINRGRIPAIFGELITLLERDKRADIPAGVPVPGTRGTVVQLPYSREWFGVPPNVYVLGTMNTADRSVAMIDFALRRRFRFEEIEPDAQLLASPGSLGDDGAPPTPEVMPWLVAAAGVLDALNRRIAQHRDRDHRVGHSYFLPLRKAPSASDLHDAFDGLFADELLPLVAEYFHHQVEALRAVVGPAFLVVSDADDDMDEVLLGFASPPDRSLVALARHLGVPLPDGA